jgi:hypothetical protein
MYVRPSRAAELIAEMAGELTAGENVAEALAAPRIPDD